LAWSPAGDELVFGGSKVGKKANINAVSLSGELRMNLYDVPGIGLRIEDISNDGKMLITQGSNHSTMMIVDEKMKAQEIGSQFAWATSADLSGDGKTLLFYVSGYEAPNADGVYLRKLDSSEAVRLGPGKGLALSPDGKWALTLQANKEPLLVLLSTTGGEVKPLPNPGIKEYHYASFFPDGRQILFTGVATGERAEIRSYVQNISTGEVHPLTEEWTVALRVSPDGQSVITLKPDKTYYVQPLDGKEPQAIPGLEAEDEPIQWSEDGRAVYVIGPGEFATKIYRVSLDTGKRRQVKEIDPPNKVGLVGLELNPGGILITTNGKVCVYTYWILLQHLITKSID
jgi:Tol biopolymer transport system component